MQAFKLIQFLIGPDGLEMIESLRFSRLSGKLERPYMQPIVFTHGSRFMSVNVWNALKEDVAICRVSFLKKRKSLRHMLRLRGTLGTCGSSSRCFTSLHGAGLVLSILRSWRLWCWTGLGHNQRFRPQSRGLELHPHAGCDDRFEGAHRVTCGADAAANGRLSVGSGPQHDPVDGA